MDNTPVYDFDEAVKFISERCEIERNIIDKVLMLDNYRICNRCSVK